MTTTATTTANEPPAPATTGYAAVNGLQLYYETYGTGDPLIVLHGGFGAIETFGPNLAAFAAHRQVIAVDLAGHGRTADRDQPITFEALADDIAGLIDHLGYKQVDILGYSLGGGAALLTAIRHRDQVRKLVLVSTAFARDGLLPDVDAAMAQMGPQSAELLIQTPLYEMYKRLAPRAADFPTLVAKVADLLHRPYDYRKDITELPPTLYVAGDADMLRLAHAVEFFTAAGGNQRDGSWDGSGRVASELAILPGTTHYDIYTSAMLPVVVEPFLAK